MVTALRYLGYYWLIVTALSLVAYDWLALKRQPEGIEWLQVLLLAPGFLLVAVGYRRKRRDVDAAGHVPPGTGPSFRFNEIANDRLRSVGQPGKWGLAQDSGLSAIPSAAQPGKWGGTQDDVTAAPRRRSQAKSLEMEQARNSLVSSVMKNGGALQQAVLLLTKKDVSVADELSRILQASEAVRKLNPDEPW